MEALVCSTMAAAVMTLMSDTDDDDTDDDTDEGGEDDAQEKDQLYHPRRRRTVWEHDWIKRRPRYGQFETLFQELKVTNRKKFRNFMRMPPEMFDQLLQKVTPFIQKQTTNFRDPLSPGHRLAITLRYLATGNTYTSLSYAFRVGDCTISRFIPEVCEAIITVLKGDYLKCPSTPGEWRSVAEGFATKWNFPNCIGALDGKHVAIYYPKKSGSLYYNYKGFHSIVLTALVDISYKFLYVDVGKNGSCADGGVFGETELRQALENGTLGLPHDEPLPGDHEPIPYCIVGDDAFPLRTWLQKPFSFRKLNGEQTIYNYRLSRARRVVENAFGILGDRYRVLRKPMEIGPDRATSVVMTCCCLHNLMRTLFPRCITRLADTEKPTLIESPLESGGGGRMP